MKLKSIIAHRGLSEVYPENTMLAFEKAHEHGVQCIETDVTILKDGTLVLFHDYTIDERTNKTGIIHELCADDLLHIDAGSWKHHDFAQQRIPTLSQLLEFAQQHAIILNIELKGEPQKNETYWHAIVEKTLECVESHAMHDFVFYSSFEIPMLRHLKKMKPEAPCGLLLWEDTSQWQTIAQELQPNSINLYDKTITEELVYDIKNAGYDIYVYTVNNITQAHNLFTMGVDGIFTDIAEQFDTQL